MNICTETLCCSTNSKSLCCELQVVISINKFAVAECIMARLVSVYISARLFFAQFQPLNLRNLLSVINAYGNTCMKFQIFIKSSIEAIDA